MHVLKKPILWVVIVLVALFGVACGSIASPTAESATEPATTEVEPDQEGVVESQPESIEESPEVVEEPTLSAVVAGDVEVLHRDNPAPPSSFVADSPEWVAATGRPQLIEFFAYW